MGKGIFISFEGTDGTGKSTQIELLRDRMHELGRETLCLREPGGTEIGEKIRDILLDVCNSEMDSRTEALLYAASRAQLVSQVIKPALDEGMIVICDRYVDSSYAYQEYARGLGDPVREINDFATDGIMPDITFLLVLDAEKGMSRIKDHPLDRIESEGSGFMTEVGSAYLKIAGKYPDRIVVTDASRPADEISREITGRVERIMA
ncbi:MAG: dTMP kinase [Anaerovoracaceae bacterium]